MKDRLPKDLVSSVGKSLNKGISDGLRKVQDVGESAIDTVSDKWSIFKETINDLPVLSSFERSSKNANTLYDEKHYFVVPYRLSDVGISLHTMRCLPDGMPEINELPKRRVFHFPHEHAEFQVREILVEQGRELAKESSAGKVHTLENLANDIDKIDKKLTYGMLLVGGAAAFVNPVLGISIAAKALIPGAGSLLNKYGLRPLGEKLTQNQINKEVAAAEDKILSEFEHASTLQIINPILQELELALNTTEAQHDPLMDFDMSRLDIEELDGQRWRELTEKAIYHIYKDCLADESAWLDASLGPEDIRWLKSLLSSRLG